MAYLKGGTVVDGNLYVEGNLNIRGQSSEEGTRYTYILNPGAHPNSIVKISTGDTGMLEPTKFTETIDANTGETIIGKTGGDVAFVMLPGDVSIGTDEVAKNLLYPYDENDSQIVSEDEPAYWKYDTSRNLTLTGRRSGDTTEYTIDAEDPNLDIYVGETVNLSGRPE